MSVRFDTWKRIRRGEHYLFPNHRERGFAWRRGVRVYRSFVKWKRGRKPPASSEPNGAALAAWDLGGS